VASSTEAILKLTESRKFALMTVNTYRAHIKNLRASLELLETRFPFVPRDTTSPDPTPCVTLSELLTPDIHKRRANAKLEIEELEEIRAKVRAAILDIDEELRCQLYINQVNSKSLKSYLAIQEMSQSAVDEISGAFRVIKRVPNEIWSDILAIRITDDSNSFPNPPGLPLFLPALPISQVCRTWRSVVRSSPSMWRVIGLRMSAGDEPNHNNIDIWKKLSGQGRLSVHEIQCEARTSAAQSLGPHLLDQSKRLNYHVLQSNAGAPNEFNADESPKYPILALGLSAPPLSRNARVQPGLYSQFSSVQGLSLSNLLPHRRLALQDSLTFLAISFSQPHKSYTLARLLIPSLHYLRLRHFEITGTPDLAEVIQLPNLFALDITPLESKLVGKLVMPQLSYIILSSPVKVSTSPDGWLDSIIALGTTVVQLQIGSDLNEQDTNTTSLNILQILTKLLPQMPKIHHVKLIDCIFDGGGLADILEKKENKGVDIRKLEELTIDHCIGVSRMDCERLVPLVGKLSVYQST
jgi:hypothetical protein